MLLRTRTTVTLRYSCEFDVGVVRDGVEEVTISAVIFDLSCLSDRHATHIVFKKCKTYLDEIATPPGLSNV